MKGIIYLVEIAISAVLIVIALSFFLSTQNVRTSFERSDLISAGNTMLTVLGYDNKLQDLVKNRTENLDRIKPANIDYAVGFYGTPKPNISVGCVAFKLSW